MADSLIEREITEISGVYISAGTDMVRKHLCPRRFSNKDLADRADTPTCGH